MKSKKIKNLIITGIIMGGGLLINALTSYQSKEEMREMIKEEIALQHSNDEENEEEA